MRFPASKDASPFAKDSQGLREECGTETGAAEIARWVGKPWHESFLSNIPMSVRQYGWLKDKVDTLSCLFDNW